MIIYCKNRILRENFKCVNFKFSNMVVKLTFFKFLPYTIVYTTKTGRKKLIPFLDLREKIYFN